MCFDCGLDCIGKDDCGEASRPQDAVYSDSVFLRTLGVETCNQVGSCTQNTRQAGAGDVGALVAQHPLA